MARLKPEAIMVLLLIPLILSIYIHGTNFRKEHLLTTGRIIHVKQGYGTHGNFGTFFTYQYYVDGSKISSSYRCKDLSNDIRKVSIGRSFPVAYNKYWFGYEDIILLTPRDFESFGHKFPDSLTWILQYMIK